VRCFRFWETVRIIRRSLARPGVVRRVIAEARERKVWSIRIARPESTNLDVSIEPERTGFKEREGGGERGFSGF